MLEEKEPNQILVATAKVLDNLKIPYYVAGGYAVSILGRPRFTADIDLVIKIKPVHVKPFALEIKKLFSDVYLDEDQINSALSHIGEFNLIEPNTGLKIDFFIAKNNPFEMGCFNRIISLELGRDDYIYKIKFTSPEDLILSKLLWFKESQSTRHLEDIQSVLDIQQKIDQTYLATWVRELDLSKEWRALGKLKR